jgi:hypothetical protein
MASENGQLARLIRLAALLDGGVLIPWQYRQPTYMQPWLERVGSWWSRTLARAILVNRFPAA